MMIPRLFFLFLCVGVSVEEVERNFVETVHFAREWDLRERGHSHGHEGSFRQQQQIQHYDRRWIPEGPPKVQVTRSNLRAQIGSNVTLECFMDSNPQATNFWMLGSERIRDNNTKYRVVEVALPNFHYRYRLRLQIVGLDMADYIETFRCFSNNKHGDAIGSINIDSVAPIVTTQNNTVEEYLGSDVILECSVDAFPIANIYWFNVTGDQILGGGRFSVFNEEPSSFRFKTQLLIRRLEMRDFTSYKCMARNRLGGSHQIIHLIKAKNKPPPKPSPSSSLKSSTRSSLVGSWTTNALNISLLLATVIVIR